MTGEPWNWASGVGSFPGLKLVLDEFVAFPDFGPQVERTSQKMVANLISATIAGILV